MDSTDAPHPRFARLYPGVAARADRRGAAGHRRRLLHGLAGRVVEVGAGDGRNFGHYPPTVTAVVAIEPEPTLRALAAEAAREAAVPVTVIPGFADELPFADGEFDAAVASLVLCSVPDQARALSELRRVLRANGELRFYEHVIARRAAEAGAVCAGRPQRAVAGARRGLSSRARHRRRDHRRGVRDRTLRADRVPLRRARAAALLHPRQRATALTP